jgi:hypothetical protein
MKTPIPQITLSEGLVAIFSIRSNEQLVKDIEVEERMMKRRESPSQSEVDFLHAMKLVLAFRMS